MNLSHLVTCCALRWQVVAKQTTFFSSKPFKLVEENREMPFSCSNYLKLTSTTPEVRLGLSSCPLCRAEGKGWKKLRGNFPCLPSCRWKTFPRKACWRHCADRECCQGRGPLLWLLLAFLVAEGERLSGWQSPQRTCLGARIPRKGPMWRVLVELLTMS